MADDGDVQLQLNNLQEEEARIMRELREIDEAENGGATHESTRRRQQQPQEEQRADPVQALNNLLLECEKEVRDAKGFIADHGPPLRIKRVRAGESAPRNATYLARPKNTGVDFTVPVTLKTYTERIKNPIFLNQIRDKMRTFKYTSVSMYIDDMRLLVRNTSSFNKDPDLQWVVQHAQLLLAAAQDAVANRRDKFDDIENALRDAGLYNRQSVSGGHHTAGKRKRSSGSGADHVNGDTKSLPPVGASIDIYWPSYRKWFLAYIIDRGDGANVRVRYEDDDSEQSLSLTDHQFKWRLHQSRGTPGGARGKKVEPPPSKRRKQHSQPVVNVDTGSVAPSGAVSMEELEGFKSELSSKMNDLSNTVTTSVNEHYNKINSMVMRSDAMQRVLIALGDMQTEIQSTLGSMTRRFDALEKRVLENQEQLKSMKSRETDNDAGNLNTTEIESDDVRIVAAEKEQKKISKPPRHQTESSDLEIVEVEKPANNEKKSTPADDVAAKPQEQSKADADQQTKKDEVPKNTHDEKENEMEVDTDNKQAEKDSSDKPVPMEVVAEDEEKARDEPALPEVEMEKETEKEIDAQLSAKEGTPKEKDDEKKVSDQAEEEPEPSPEESKTTDDKTNENMQLKSGDEVQADVNKPDEQSKQSLDKTQKDNEIANVQPGKDVVHPIKTIKSSGSEAVDNMDLGDDSDKKPTASEKGEPSEKSNEGNEATDKAIENGEKKDDEKEEKDKEQDAKETKKSEVSKPKDAVGSENEKKTTEESANPEKDAEKDSQDEEETKLPDSASQEKSEKKDEKKDASAVKENDKPEKLSTKEANIDSENVKSQENAKESEAKDKTSE